MANVQSTLVSNEANVPIIYNKVGLYGARLRSIVATAEGLGFVGNTYMMCKLLSNWRVLHIWTYMDTNAGATDCNVGLYSDASGTKVDDNCYADAQTFAVAKTISPIDLAYKTRDIIKMGQEVYLDAGHTTANKLDEYWLGIETPNAGDATGSFTMTMNIQFTVD